MILDPLAIAQMDKSKPLTITNATRSCTCCLCGAPLDEHAWIVKIGRRIAQPGCAEDYGWTVVG